MKFLIFDVEADGLLKEATKIHCCSIHTEEGGIRTTTDYNQMRKLFLTEGFYFVGHNIQQYDKPLLEKLLGIKLDYTKFIDTLAISYVKDSKKPKVGLEYYGEEFGIPKIEVEDSQWKEGDAELMKLRCERDVAINKRLFDEQLAYFRQLYNSEEKLMEYFRYLSFKMYTLHVQEMNPFKLDIEQCKKNYEELEALRQTKLDALEAVMPPKKVYAERKPPAKPFKQDGTLSANGQKWLELTQEHNLPFEHSEPIKVVVSEDKPSANSPTQLKDWLFSLGWKPKIFTQGANGEVPQIYNDDKEVCESVLKLGEEMHNLDALGVIKHRLGLLKGFLRDVDDEGYIAGWAHGFASTLRLRHAKIANLPKPSMPFGEKVRGVLCCDEDEYMVDSDLASLENMIKLDLIYDVNPAKVEEELGEDYDSHLAIGKVARMLSDEDIAWFKQQKKLEHPEDKERFTRLGDIRHKAKTVNYSAQYGVGKAKLAKTLEIKQSEAKKLLDAYWEQNKEIKGISSKWSTKNVGDRTWILNPYNDFWYELRNEKDRISAIIQGTGDYVCYAWALFVIRELQTLTWVYHDQLDLRVKRSEKERVKNVLHDSIEKVNKFMKFKVPMSVSVNFGQNLAEVH